MKGRGGEEELTAHNPDVFFMFGEALDWEIRASFLQRCEGMAGVGDAGVFEPRLGVVVAVGW